VEWYEAEVRQLEKEVVARAGADPVVFYGSSTIRLWKTLSQDMGDDYMLNLAFGGSTLEACGVFFEMLVVPVHPRSLVVYAGDNDLGDGRGPAQVLEYFNRLADKVQSQLPGIPFGFISIKPSPARFGIIDRIAQANAAIAEEITHRPNAYYIDLFPDMLGADGKPRKELFLPDGLHLNKAGYRLWKEILLKHRDRIFPRANEAHVKGIP